MHLATASVARAFSANLDELTNNTMSAAFLETFPLDSDTLSPYVDFFCMAITLALAGKAITIYNNWLEIGNLCHNLINGL